VDITARLLDGKAEAEHVDLGLAAGVNRVQRRVGGLRVSRGSRRLTSEFSRSSNGSFFGVILLLIIVGLSRLLLTLFFRLKCKSRWISSRVRRTTHHQLALAFNRDDMNEQGKRRRGDDEQSQSDL
jgi:hypothetical protein